MRRTVRAPVILLVLAIVLAMPFAVFHLLGYREDVSALSLTLPSGDWQACQVRCEAYLITYFIALLASPILLIASGLLACWERLLRGKSGTP